MEHKAGALHDSPNPEEEQGDLILLFFLNFLPCVTDSIYQHTHRNIPA